MEQASFAVNYHFVNIREAAALRLMSAIDAGVAENCRLCPKTFSRPFPRASP